MGIGNANAIHQFDGFLYLQPMSLESIGTLDNTMHIRIKKRKRDQSPYCGMERDLSFRWENIL